MIIRSDNICLDIDLVTECINELDISIGDRKSFFDSLVIDRLDKCNRRCVEDFSDKLSILDNKLERNNYNMREIFTVVKKLTKAASSVYSTQITLFKSLSEEK